MSEKDSPPENDTSERTVLHLKKRSDPPPPSVASDLGPMSVRTRTDGEAPIEPFDDIETLVAEMRKPAADRIEDQGLVASGGMGAVHLVVDKAIGRKMAMKTMHAMLREDDRMLRLFLREARTTGLLDHPNIVPVYDVGEQDGALYFTMKLVSRSHAARHHPRGAERRHRSERCSSTCST